MKMKIIFNLVRFYRPIPSIIQRNPVTNVLTINNSEKIIIANVEFVLSAFFLFRMINPAMATNNNIQFNIG